MLKTSNRSKVLLLVSLLAVMLCMSGGNAVCATYSDSGIESSLKSVTDYVTKVIGAFVVVIGIVMVGIKMSIGDYEAIKSGAMVVMGGLLIFLSNNILNLIKSFAGTR